MLGRFVTIVLAALCVGACVDPVKELKPIPADVIARMRISDVVVAPGDGQVPATIVSSVKSWTQAYVAKCATGAEQYAIEVRVDNFKAANPGAVMLVGDTATLAGQVRVVRPSDRAVVGEYYVQELLAGGGLIGLAITSSADKRLPQMFARRVCSNIFKNDVGTLEG